MNNKTNKPFTLTQEEATALLHNYGKQLSALMMNTPDEDCKKYDTPDGLFTIMQLCDTQYAIKMTLHQANEIRAASIADKEPYFAVTDAGVVCSKCLMPPLGSEITLERAKLCAACGKRRYCCRTAQKADWKTHKQNCTKPNETT